MHLLFSEKMHPRANVAYFIRNVKLSQLLLLGPGRCPSLLWTGPHTATFIGPARRYRVSKRGIGATLTKAQAVQTQLDVLADWIAELGENFDNDLNRVIPFEYSAKLAALWNCMASTIPTRPGPSSRLESRRFRTCTIGFRLRVSIFLPRVQA
jgi:hypothetical protein